MNEVAEEWASQDPVATAEWINQIPADVNKDPLIETLVNKIHKTDPVSALVWAETISSPERRKFMTELVERSVQKRNFLKGDDPHSVTPLNTIQLGSGTRVIAPF